MRKQNAAEAASASHPRGFLERTMGLRAGILCELHEILLMYSVHSLPPTVHILLKGQIPLTGHEEKKVFLQSKRSGIALGLSVI